jgi:Leucine-rich repeat (LRR) protein
MSLFEDLSGEILMAIFEYMDVEDVWTIFFNMNTRLNSLVFDSRLRLTADVSKIEKYNFDQFCLSLIQTNFNNIFTLILSNNYYRYPQIRLFLSHTNLTYFQSLYSLTLIDINHDELMDITKQIKQLNNLNHLHINTHEIFNDKQLANVTPAVFDQPNIRVLGLGFHEVNSIRILSKNLFIFHLLEYSMA